MQVRKHYAVVIAGSCYLANAGRSIRTIGVPLQYVMEHSSKIRKSSSLVEETQPKGEERI